jgi:hypothetical protein
MSRVLPKAAFLYCIGLASGFLLAWYFLSLPAPPRFAGAQDIIDKLAAKGIRIYLVPSSKSDVGSPVFFLSTTPKSFEDVVDLQRQQSEKWRGLLRCEEDRPAICLEPDDVRIGGYVFSGDPVLIEALRR